MPASAGPPPGSSLIDAAVEVRGVCLTLFNDHRRLQGVRLQVPGWAQIDVKESAPADPFNLPLRPVDELFQFLPGSSTLHRVHVEGTVTRTQTDGSFFLQNGTDGIYVQTRGPVRFLEVGESVEVVGFTGINDELPCLQNALVKPTGRRMAVKIERLKPQNALDPERHAALVEVRGRVVGQSSLADRQVITIEIRPARGGCHLGNGKRVGAPAEIGSGQRGGRERRLCGAGG